VLGSAESMRQHVLLSFVLLPMVLGRAASGSTCVSGLEVTSWEMPVDDARAKHNKELMSHQATFTFDNSEKLATVDFALSGGTPFEVSNLWGAVVSFASGGRVSSDDQWKGKETTSLTLEGRGGDKVGMQFFSKGKLTPQKMKAKCPQYDKVERLADQEVCNEALGGVSLNIQSIWTAANDPTGVKGFYGGEYRQVEGWQQGPLRLC